MEAIERFVRFIELNDNGCWVWTGGVEYDHGMFWVDGDSVSARRYIMGLSKDDKRIAMSSCKNNLCVNPDHLYLINKTDKRGGKRPIDLFMSHVEKMDDGCWKWTAAITRGGYGVFRTEGINHPAHRWLYEYFNGKIQDDLECDHLCRNRWCVNPSHIEPVTKLENVRRGDGGKWQKDKTHCKNGHEFTDENTVIHTHKNNGRVYKTRACKKCISSRRKSSESKEYMKKYCHEKYMANRESFIQKASEWAKNNRDKVNEYKRNYRKRKKESTA